jgi:hypothetical protein
MVLASLLTVWVRQRRFTLDHTGRFARARRLRAIGLVVGIIGPLT